jgi:acetyl-CoA carboxylase carboxyl transferase subunit beta
MLCDPGSFRPSLTPAAFFDPLVFQDTEAYCSRWEGACRKTQLDEAIQWGEAALAQNPIILAVMDFAFMGGSMGSTVGERVALACEAALARHIPLLVVCASGGARMQEGLFSLLQMAKTALSFQRLRDSAIPIISLLTDPTCGGVTASFGTLADLILAEPGALICFTGPRVIEQNLRQKLPEEAQKAEFLLAKGMVDQIVPRERQKEQIARYLGYLRPHV